MFILIPYSTHRILLNVSVLNLPCTAKMGSVCFLGLYLNKHLLFAIFLEQTAEYFCFGRDTCLASSLGDPAASDHCCQRCRFEVNDCFSFVHIQLP